MFIPRTEKAMKDFLKVVLNSKSDYIQIKDTDSLLIKRRKEYLIGEDIRDYEYCPYEYRPVPFRNKYYRENVTEDMRISNMRDREKNILFYDFFFSETIGNQMLNGELAFSFYKTIKDKKISFVVFPKLAQNGYNSKAFKVYSYNEIAQNVKGYGDAFAECILNVEQISNKIDNFDATEIIEDVW